MVKSADLGNGARLFTCSSFLLCLFYLISVACRSSLGSCALFGFRASDVFQTLRELSRRASFSFLPLALHSAIVSDSKYISHDVFSLRLPNLAGSCRVLNFDLCHRSTSPYFRNSNICSCISGQLLCDIIAA